MTVSTGESVYIDIGVFLRAPTGQETASLLGLNTATGGTATLPAGTVTLPVENATGWVAGSLWLLDGPWSEQVEVTGSPDSTHLTLSGSGTAFAHGPGVSASQSGTAGSLAETLVRASNWVDGYCQQGTSFDRSLFASQRTERWAIPGRRGGLDVDGILWVRPGHFPVQAVTGLMVDAGYGQTTDLDSTQAEVTSDGRMVEIPALTLAPVTAGAAATPGLDRSSRFRRQWVSIIYLGGFTPGELPYGIQQATIWVASEMLAQRRNPSGAALLRQGKFEMQLRLRGDPVDESLLLSKARAALEPFRDTGM